jgi:RecJ-like exonuclease
MDEIKKICDINEEDATIIGKIIDIYQTTGPTIFGINDETKTLTVAAFAGPGKRAYPEINVGDIVKMKIVFKEKKEGKKAEAIEIQKIEDKEKEKIEKLLENRRLEKIKIEDFEFIVKSVVLEKLKERFKKAAFEIKKAIMDGRPILIRHHNDADGFCSGIALERSISELVKEMHGEENVWKYVIRVVSRTPFYSIEDAIRDITFHQLWKSKFSDKEPLLILADNGSTHEDEFSVKKVKIYGFNIIVIDHHSPNDSKIEELVDVHINPYVVGGDKNICAAMLCSELAKILYKDVDVDFIPALAGIADMCDGLEMNQYLEIAKTKFGFDEEYLKKVAECIDFEAYYLGFIEGKGIIDDLLLNNIKRHGKLVDLLYEELKEKQKMNVEIVKEGLEIKEIGKFALITIDFGKNYYPKEYPPVGKLMSLISLEFEEKYENFVIFGYVKDLGIGVIRAKNFNMLEFLDKVKQRIKSISGGGHEVAGSVRFAPRDFEKILKELEDTLKTI